MSTLDTILDTGIIAIIRANSSDNLMAAADALLAGGVKAIEVTLTTPGALDTVSKAVAKFGSAVVIGVGSVLDPESARAAILAGAQFLVCPTLNLRTIKVSKRYGIPIMPGAYTPTEILTAWEAGAEIIKVFPADTLGPKFIKAVKAPMPQVRLSPTGGVDLSNVAEYIRAGSDAVAVGTALINQKLLDSKDFQGITERARRFCEEVAKARADH
jgi:2-dehydro-3-deoxyphosphogluconate aldolase/(4S)-4-hydroxy-2-oxoglutarate aldolase